MTAPRTCGATFVPIAVVPAGGDAAPDDCAGPNRRHLKGVDILCGTKGAVCSVKHPDGVPVELYPEADPGYTFMGFVGDCRPLGHTQMTGPRTCGGTFSLTVFAPEKASRCRAAPAKPTAPVGTGSCATKNPVQAATVPPSPSRGRQHRSLARPFPLHLAQIRSMPLRRNPRRGFREGANSANPHGLLPGASRRSIPTAVQKVFPKVDMATLQYAAELVQIQVRAMQVWRTGFVTLNPSAGTAKVMADVKRRL